MTTVPGHNIVIQQSVAAQELTQNAHSPKPSPEQAAAQQEVNERIKNTTVQEFEEAENLKAKSEKDQFRKREQEERKRKKKRQEELELDPEATGKLLDTTI